MHLTGVEDLYERVGDGKKTRYRRWGVKFASNAKRHGTTYVVIPWRDSSLTILHLHGAATVLPSTIVAEETLREEILRLLQERRVWSLAEIAAEVAYYVTRRSQLKGVVALGVVRREGKYLFGRRSSGPAFRGFWEFPGGKLEEGETAEDAAKREFLEETGEMFTVEREITRGSAVSSTGHVFGFVSFEGTMLPLEGEPLLNASGVHDEYRWLTLREAANLDPMTPATAMTLAILLDEERRRGI